MIHGQELCKTIQVNFKNYRIIKERKSGVIFANFFKLNQNTDKLRLIVTNVINIRKSNFWFDQSHMQEEVCIEHIKPIDVLLFLLSDLPTNFLHCCPQVHGCYLLRMRFET